MLIPTIEVAMGLLTSATSILEECAEQSTFFTAVVAVVSKHEAALMLTVKYTAEGGNVELSMRLWESCTFVECDMTYENLLDIIFAELLKFALNGDFGVLKEVRKILLVENN